MTIRLVVTGTEGQVARSLADQAHDFPGIAVTALGRPQLDLEAPDTIAQAIAASNPHLVVNAAAYTAVDKAEGERDRAFRINSDGAGAVAGAAQVCGAAFVQLSTDYVYDGSKATPYFESDATGPMGVYGASKLAGEAAVLRHHSAPLIFRTAWVYSPFGTNFVKTMLRLAGERPKLRVVADQIGNPTAALDIARAILTLTPQILHDRAGGIYHLAGEGHTTWCDLARNIFEESKSRGGPTADVEAITTVEYPTPAKRPANSRLDTSAFNARFAYRLPHWRIGVAEAVSRLVAAQNGAALTSP